MQTAGKYQQLANPKEVNLTAGNCRDLSAQEMWELNAAVALLQLQNNCSEQLMESPTCTTHAALKEAWCCTGTVKLKQFCPLEWWAESKLVYLDEFTLAPQQCCFCGQTGLHSNRCLDWRPHRISNLKLRNKLQEKVISCFEKIFYLFQRLET